MKFKEALEQLAQGESGNLDCFLTVVRKRLGCAIKRRDKCPPPIGKTRKLVKSSHFQTVVREMSVKFKEALEQLAQGES